MARYRAKQLCFVDGSKIKPGQTFSTDAPPNDAWESLDDPKPAPKSEAKPAPKPVEDPFDAMDDEQARNYIASKGGKAPGPKASIEAVRNAARAAAGTDGAS